MLALGIIWLFTSLLNTTLSVLASPSVTFPFTVRLLLIVVSPVLAPMLRVVAAPAKFIVVATVFHKFCVV